MEEAEERGTSEKKKGLSREFSKPLDSSSDLIPSEFDVSPHIIERVEADSPIDILRRQKPVNRPIPQRPIFPKPLLQKPIPPKPPLQLPNRDRVKFVVEKLNAAKKLNKENLLNVNGKVQYYEKRKEVAKEESSELINLDKREIISREPVYISKGNVKDKQEKLKGYKPEKQENI